MTTRQIQDPEPGEPFTGQAGSEGAPETKAKPAGKEAPQKLKRGFWLDEADEAKVAKDVVRRWKAQDKAAKNRAARWDYNVRRRDGDPYSKLRYDPDTGEYSLYVALGSENAPPSLNKTDALCSKMVANLLVDPPKPDVEPPSDADEDRASAEFSTRALLDLHSEAGLGMDEVLREAEELACSYASAFTRYWVDPHAGGYRAKDVMAGFDPQTNERATTEADALLRPVAPADPMAPPPEPQPWPQYEIRYVMPDGTLTDNESEAEIVWLPKIRHETVTGKHVRFLPDTAKGIRDAEGAIVAGFISIGQLRRLFPEKMDEMSTEDLLALVKHRPERSKDLLPRHVQVRDGLEEKRADGEDGPPDDALVLCYTLYYVPCPDYRRGAHVVVGGDKFVLYRESLCLEQPDDEGKVKVHHMDLPLAQCRQFYDPKDQDPYGRGLVDKIGDGDPLLAMAIGYLVEYVYRANNPHLFVPVGSGIPEKALGLPRGTPIPYNGAAGTPVFEQIPPFAQATMELHDRIDAYMNDRSGLHDVAQGESSPEVKSGRHARIIVEQALVALSGSLAAMREFYTRSCRIQLQLMRAHYSTPQKIRITGEDAAYKVREWTGADLGTTQDIRVQAGTGTMLAPSAKAAVASEQLEIAMARQDQRGVDQYYRALTGNVHPLLGLEDDPALLEVRQSITQWQEGPPEGFEMAFAQYQMELQAFQMAQQEQQMLAAQTGQMPQQAMQPPAMPMDPFTPRPNHADPEVALVRFKELSHGMSGTKYAKQPPEWRSVYDQAYEKARQEAGRSTMAEQQQAMAQQAEADRQAKAEQLGHAASESDKERAFRGSESSKDREASAERDAQRNEIAAMRAA